MAAITDRGYCRGCEQFYRPTPSLPYLLQPQSVQTIWIHTTKHRGQYKRRRQGRGKISNGRSSLRHWQLCNNECFSHFDISMAGYECNTSRFVFGLIFVPSFRQTPIWLGGWFKNMYTNEPESWKIFCPWFIPSLVLVQRATIVASFKQREAVDDVVSNRPSVFDVRCAALWIKQWIFRN